MKRNKSQLDYHWLFNIDGKRSNKQEMKTKNPIEWLTKIELIFKMCTVHTFVLQYSFYFCLVCLISCMCLYAFAWNEIKKIVEKNGTDSIWLLSIYSNRSDKILIRDVWKLICVCNVCMRPFGGIHINSLFFFFRPEIDRHCVY